MRVLILVWSLMVVGLPVFAAASAADRPSAIEAAADPGGTCDVDPTKAASLAFAPVATGVVHQRGTDGPVWLRTRLGNPTPEPIERVVAIWFPYLAEVTMIVTDSAGRIASSRHGASISRPAEALPSAVPAFAVRVPAHGSARVLLCIDSSPVVIAPVHVLPMSAFWRGATADAAKVALMLGVIASALIYAATCAVTLRQPVFLAFVAFAAAALCHVALATGYAKLWFWPERDWDTLTLYGIAQAALIASGVLFLRVLLRPCRASPLVDRGMIVLIVVAAATAVAMILPAPVRTAAHAVAAGIGPLAVLIAVLHLWRRGVRHAGAAAVGWGPGLLASLHLQLRVYDITPYHPWNHLLAPAAVTFACACFAWVLAQSIRSARERALIDPLTGLWNRRWLSAEAEAAMARCRRSGAPLSVCVFDVDHFKGINDRWGHATGDAVLTQLAERTTQTLRPTDRIARIGGEEFCVLFPGLTDAQAAAALERVRAAIEATAVGPLPAGAVTISGGVAMNRGGTVPFGMLLNAADAALYRAKRTGRNRVEIAPEVVPSVAAAAGRRTEDRLRPLFADAK